MAQIVQMLYSHVNALVAVGAYIGYIGIVFYIVIKQTVGIVVFLSCCIHSS